MQTIIKCWTTVFFCCYWMPHSPNVPPSHPRPHAVVARSISFPNRAQIKKEQQESDSEYDYTSHRPCGPICVVINATGNPDKPLQLELIGVLFHNSMMASTSRCGSTVSGFSDE